MTTRRVVTGTDPSGKSVVISDGLSPREMALKHTPGFVSAPLWKLDGPPGMGPPPADPMSVNGTLLASPGGSVFWMITFPPDSVMMSSEWDPALAMPEHAEFSPGIAELFEPDHPGMHRTPTLDYVTVVKGTLMLELDDGKMVSLQPGDTVVQQGSRHAWRNPSAEPATISVVMLGLAGPR